MDRFELSIKHDNIIEKVTVVFREVDKLGVVNAAGSLKSLPCVKIPSACQCLCLRVLPIPEMFRSMRLIAGLRATIPAHLQIEWIPTHHRGKAYPLYGQVAFLRSKRREKTSQPLIDLYPQTTPD